MIHLTSIVVTILQFLFYLIFNSSLQYFFYFKRKNNAERWKIRADLPIHQTTSDSRSFGWDSWWFPMKWLFDVHGNSKPERHPLHVYFGSFNLVLSSFCAGVVTELVLTGDSSLVLHNSFFPTTLIFSDTETNNYSIFWLLRGWFLSMALECVLEYYWHRTMHLPFFYRHMHKHHHFYKSPQPFDDMMIHPLEAAGYYCILYGPAILVNQPLLGFFMYMAVMGSAGVLDHSGIKFNIPHVYSTQEHDDHHRLFNVNYSFPFPHMDMIHGTHYKKIEGLTATKK